MSESINASVLVIDDEEMVRDNIEEILVPRRKSQESENADLAASILFDTPATQASKKNSTPRFKVDKAANGMEGVEMIKRSVREGRPYAVIFLDMRMPGWDGMETAVEIRKHDSMAEIIFVTAFSDRSIDDIIAQAGENVGYHCKPYASEEITQIATKAVSDYNKLRNLERLIVAISSISVDEQQLTPLLSNILDQLATYVETDTALMGKLPENNEYEKVFNIGPVEDKINMGELIDQIRSVEVGEGQVVQVDDVVVARLENYTVFAVLKKQERLKTEKLYLLKLFVLNAAKAIRNAELREKLIRKEKLSAIGNAVSMMMHDLRSPIKNINQLTTLMRDEGTQSEWLDMIDQCGEQASAIFEDFLDFIRETPVKKMPVRLEKVVEEGIKLAEANVPHGPVVIRKSISCETAVTGDESKLIRCIMNLVSNATEALLSSKISEPRIDISAAVSNGQVVLVVRDNGKGIPAEIIRTLFDPFVTRDKSNGTGLGLAIVKQYIAAHGGQVKVENDKGAVFTITLPNGK